MAFVLVQWKGGAHGKLFIWASVFLPVFSWAWSWTGCACCMRRHLWAKKSPNAARSRWWTDGHVSLLWHLMKHMYPKLLMINCSPSMQIYAPFPMLRNKSRNKREEYFTTLCVGSFDSENCKWAAFSEIVIIYLKYESIDHDKQIKVSRIKWIAFCFFSKRKKKTSSSCHKPFRIMDKSCSRTIS